MPIDPGEVAEAAVRVAHFAAGEATINVDVGAWNADQVCALLDALLTQANTYKLRLRGVRTDTSGFAKLGIPQDTSNSGKYKGVPVVMTPSVDFDMMEFVLQPWLR